MNESEKVVGACAIDKISNLRVEKNKKLQIRLHAPVKMEQDRNRCVFNLAKTVYLKMEMYIIMYELMKWKVLKDILYNKL